VASPPVAVGLRIIGGEAFGVPVLNASGITPPGIACQAYMPFPAGQGDLIWQGSVFGLTAPDSGGLHANIWQVAVTVTHCCSAPSDFTSVTAQVYDTNTSTVLTSQPFTLSAGFITETITLTTGFPYADIADLAVRLVWHQVAVGYACVQHAHAAISYSYSDSIGSIDIAPVASMPAPAVSVAPLPPVALVASGAVVNSLTPAFGKPTIAGDLLIAWVYTNGSSSTFSTTCSNPSWTLAGHAGAAFGWESLWYKAGCGTAETAPVFSDTGYSEPMSQLLEFSGARQLDQVGTGTGTPGVTYTASGPDTASGDLIFGFAAWNGSNTGPAVIGLTGTDSSGAALGLNVTDNAANTGTQFWATGWGQASAPAGPGQDTMSATFSFFAGGGGVMASFKTFAVPAPVTPARPRVINRVVIVPIRIG
jgi:hypothetical protein